MNNLNELNSEYEKLRLEYNECVHIIQNTITRKSHVEQKMWKLGLDIGNLKKSLEKA
jgi:hypothetical protein